METTTKIIGVNGRLIYYVVDTEVGEINDCSSRAALVAAIPPSDDLTVNPDDIYIDLDLSPRGRMRSGTNYTNRSKQIRR